MRLFRRTHEEMTNDSDPELVQALRMLGDRWNPVAVALNAAYLTDAKLVRDLIDGGSRHISFQPKPDAWDSSPEVALIRAGHRIAELEGAVNAVHAHAKDARKSLVEPDHSVAPVLDDIVEITNSVRDSRASGS